MAKAKPTITTVAAPHALDFPRNEQVTLPDGRTLNKGDLVRITTEPGAEFRFKYERRGDITVFGGNGTADKGHFGWRSFTPEQIAPTVVVTLTSVPDEYAAMSPGQKAAYTRRANTGSTVAVAKVGAEVPAEYAAMTPGQKAAYTKRMQRGAA